MSENKRAAFWSGVLLIVLFACTATLFAGFEEKPEREIPVTIGQLGFYPRRIASLANHLPYLGMPEAVCGRNEVYGFENIGFTLSIISYKNIHIISKRNSNIRIISKI